MKILSIGNSFSQDAHKFLNELSAQNGYQIETTNLYIGGCSLEQHYNNAFGGNADYDVEYNGGPSEGKMGIVDALKSDEWDFVTLQQASGVSGKPQSYIPYITELMKIVKKYSPNSQVLFHQTWSYEIDSTHSAFEYYNFDQKEMYRRLSDAAEMVKSY